jgi:predicted glycosyltransferase
MERRDWSLKGLQQLQYIDSLDPDEIKAKTLSSWVNTYLSNGSKIEDFDLNYTELKRLEELFFKNLSFIKQYSHEMKKDLDDYKKIKKFLE